MRARPITLGIVMLLNFTVHAQTNPPYDKPVRIDTYRKPLFLIGNIQTEADYVFMDMSSIEAVSVFKDSNAIAKYGDAGKHGVVIVIPKKDVRLLQISKILEIYSLAGNQDSLRVCINNVLMPRPSLIVIQETELIGVEITSEKVWEDIRGARPNEKFINISVKKRK